MIFWQGQLFCIEEQLSGILSKSGLSRYVTTEKGGKMKRFLCLFGILCLMGPGSLAAISQDTLPADSDPFSGNTEINLNQSGDYAKKTDDRPLPKTEEPVPLDDKRAETVAPRPGATARLIRVPLPITPGVQAGIRREIEQMITTLPKDEPGRPIVIFEFLTAADNSGGKTEFGDAVDLARLIASKRMTRFRTVAYVPRSIDDLALLPVMACEEIIMNESAFLGSDGTNVTEIEDIYVPAFETFAAQRNTLPAALAMGMLDPDIAVYRITPGRWNAMGHRIGA